MIEGVFNNRRRKEEEDVMKKKIDARMIVKGVLGDMKIFFPQWFPLVLKMSVLWAVCQLLLYRIFWDSSLEGFLSEVSYAWLVDLLSGGGDGQGLFLHGVFALCVLVSGFFLESGVGSAWLMYGRSGGCEGGKSLPLWNGRGLFFLWMWIKFYVTTVVVSILISLVLSLGVCIVLGVLGFLLGITQQSIFWLALSVGFVLNYMITCYVGVRFCLVFAGFARGESVGFFESWRALKVDIVPLTVIGFFVFLLPILVSMLIGFFLGFFVVLLGLSEGVVKVVSFALGLVLSMTSMVMFMMVVERIDRVLREGGRSGI